MPAIQAPDPLLGASPALRPTARPLPIQVGATPPPRRSPLMELADAFGNVDSELRDMLRDTVAREERDAQALGEIEATKARAEGRIGELDKILKAKVDAGELPSVRLPAAQRGAALRTGHEHAEVGLQTYLLSKREAAVRGTPEELEAIISEGLQKFGAAIGPQAFYERVGFDRASADVVNHFRRRVGQEQAIEAERYQREKRADEGAELAFQLATADAENVGTAKGLLKAHLDTIRGEMPKSEVNAFFSKGVLAPAVARLVEQKDFMGAAQLLEEVKTLDLTGKGGLYGKTAEGSSTLLELSNMVETRGRMARNVDADRLRDDAFVAEQIGRNKAAEVIFNTRQENSGNLPLEQRQRLLADARANLNPLEYQTFSAVLNAEYENDERFKLNPQAGAKLLSDVETLDPKLLELRADEANTLLARGEISADVYHRADQTIRRNKALAGAVEDRDVEAFQKAVFAAPHPYARGATTISVGDESLAATWEQMNEQAKTDVRVAASDFFVEQFRQQIRLLSKANPDEIPAIKAQAFDKASTAAQSFAQSAIAAKSKDQKRTAENVRVIEQRALIDAARQLFPTRTAIQDAMQSYAEAQLVYLPESLRQNSETTDGKEDSPRNLKEILQQQRGTPAAEWDVVILPAQVRRSVFRDATIRRNVVDLASLAKVIHARTPVQTKEADEALRYYSVAKASAGFTPEELRAGKTKHGIPFDPDRIDPRTIAVFRSVAELEKEWNGGDVSDLFLEVGDLIDPGHRITAEEFYSAQLALLSAR